MFMILFSTRVSAASAWSLSGDAYEEGSAYVLTPCKTRAAGGFSKRVPLDTRKGFTLSFQYWIGDMLNDPREGFQLVFSNNPVASGSYGRQLGYWMYIGDDGTNFYGVRFDTYSRSIDAVKNSGNNLDYLGSSERIEFERDTWHSVVVEYKNGNLEVWQDQIKVLSCSKFTMPELAWFGFTASTSYYGCQQQVIRNVNFRAQDACLIRLNANKGTCTASSMYLLKNCRSNAVLPVPTRAHYLFLGWYTKATGGTKVNEASYNFSDGQTLYAHWKDTRLTVKFNPNKGKVSVKSRLVDPKAKIGKLPVPTRKGYVFLGWYTSRTGGKKISSTQVVKANTTYYAHWISSSRKVTFKLNKNGGTCSKSSITVTYGGKLTGLPTPVRSGYQFLGWYTAKTGGTRVKASTKTSTIAGKKTLYAHWQKKNTTGSGSGSGGGSGSSFSPDCTSCRGSGDCSNCGGDGYVYSYAMKNERLNCYKCNGSGKCSTCGGTGKRY